MEKNRHYIKKVTLFFLIGLLFNSFLWSEETMNNEKLETILQGRNTTVEMYLYPFSALTRFPLNESFVREAYECKILIKNSGVYGIKNFIITANNLSKDQPKNTRLLIDILVDDKIVYTISISVGDMPISEIIQVFEMLL